MVGQGNGIIDLSVPISQVEMALDNYAYFPYEGLESLQLALLTLQKKTCSSSFPSIYQSRLSSLVSAVDQLLANGAPYFQSYHNAFLSAADSLFQLAVGCQFSIDQSMQLHNLLSLDRPCWVVVTSLIQEAVTSPVYINYQAKYDAGKEGENRSIDEYLSLFSGVGQVSFQLDIAEGVVKRGRFLLLTVQSLSWLQTRFPMLDWRIDSVNEEESLKRLCELSFLPLFQHTTMQKDVRYRLLALYEERLKRIGFQPFSEVFSPNFECIEQPDRLVPQKSQMMGMEGVEDTTYFPMRYGGSMYICASHSVGAHSKSSFSCKEDLGYDFLPYFLYEIETPYGPLVFDKTECLGLFFVSAGDLELFEDTFWFDVNEDVSAQVVLSSPFLLTANNSAFCLLPTSVSDLLVVKQGSRYFALPYLSVREVEAVCSKMRTSNPLIKNIWLSRFNTPLLEPWLLDFRFALEARKGTVKNKSMYPVKKGYYSVRFHGKTLWIEADLVFALTSYQRPLEIAYLNQNKLCFWSFIVHDGYCFDKVLLTSIDNEEQGSCSESNTFTMYLDQLGEAVVLHLTSCEWFVSLPDEHYEADFSMFNEWMGNKKSICCPLADSEKGAVVLNKKNYLSFVASAECWQPPSLF
ncbi:MAG: hypothetical protein HWE24_03350 [Oceanospirillaceae bacterium]|nr:hypothetical protein [Oceanospirillaceae bacterium]